jgi:hypothetical protein
MVNMRPLSKSNQESDDHEPHPWLIEKVYGRQRQRTIGLVRRSVDALLKDSQRVSLATIVAKSKELDTNHQGISQSAILDNQEARAYYKRHRSWHGTPRSRTKPTVVAPQVTAKPVKSDRNEQRARQRYLRMSKEDLVERLLALERIYAEKRERWLLQQDDVLTWQLRAEEAERQREASTQEGMEQNRE